MSWARKIAEPAIVILGVSLVFGSVIVALVGEEAKKSRAVEECGVYAVLSSAAVHERFPWRKGTVRVVCATEDPSKGRVVEVGY